jgi:cysteine-rich repeat protein
MYKFILSLCFLSLGCLRAVCGDGVLEKGEACDDANLTNADGCEADCTLPACNNGIVDPGELCFFKPILLDTDSTPQNIVAADFNRDGSLDLVTVNPLGHSLSILLGDGFGGFFRMPDVELDPVAASNFFAVGDFDGDGVLDLVASLSIINRVDIFRGLGDGSFSPLVTLSILSPDHMVVGDFSKNGAPDLVVASRDEFVLHLNNGSGSFLPPRIFSAPSLGVLASGDINGDNNLDLVATQGGAEGGFRVFLGDGLGNFSAQTLQLASNPAFLLIDDFDADDVLDLSVSFFGPDEIDIFTGNGDGLFSEPQTFSLTRPRVLASGDINNDGRLDLAVASEFDVALNSSHLGLFLNDSAGGFEALPLLLVSNGGVRGLALADFNEDGALDAALSDESNAQVVVFLSEP